MRLLTTFLILISFSAANAQWYDAGEIEAYLTKENGIVFININETLPANYLQEFEHHAYEWRRSPCEVGQPLAFVTEYDSTSLKIEMPDEVVNTLFLRRCTLWQGQAGTQSNVTYDIELDPYEYSEIIQDTLYLYDTIYLPVIIDVPEEETNYIDRAEIMTNGKKITISTRFTEEKTPALVHYVTPSHGIGSFEWDGHSMQMTFTESGLHVLCFEYDDGKEEVESIILVN